MNLLLSWGDLAIKLLLIIGGAFNIFLLAYRKKVDFITFPFIFALVFPFFLVFKVTEVLGNGSLNPPVYWLIALLLNLSWLVQIAFGQVDFSKIYDHILQICKVHALIIGAIGFLLVFFCLRGLYLEYPGDAIDYFQRTGLANQDTGVSISLLWRYSAYNTFSNSFQQWLSGSDIFLRPKLAFIAAINMCALCLATYRTAYWCTQKQKSSVTAVLLSLAFYGCLQISFYLYKSLQGANLAMILYLESLPWIYTLLTTCKWHELKIPSKFYGFLALPLMLWVMLDCHQEKVLFIFVVTLSVSGMILLKSLICRDRPPVLSILAFPGLVLIFLTSFFWNKDFVGLDLLLIKQWFSIGNLEVYAYWPAPPNSYYILLDMVCISLILITLAISKTQSKAFFMASVALSPLLFFLNPIFITGLLKVTIAANIYRLMTGGLAWIFLVVACNNLQRLKKINISYLPGLFVLLGFLAFAPIFGQFPHLLLSVPPYADGRDLQPVIEYLLTRRDQDADVPTSILADPYTNSYLGAWPQFQVVSNRWLRSDPATYGESLAYLLGSEISEAEITSSLTESNFEIIILNRRTNLSYYTSWIARMSDHWPADVIQSHRVLFSTDSLHSYLTDNSDHQYQNVFEANGFEVYEKTKPLQ